MKPTLLVSPSDEVDEGSTVVFVCHAEGSLPITYTWYNKNNLLKQPSSTTTSSSNVFQVTNVERLNSSSSTGYRCRASNSAGWKESTEKEIVVRCKKCSFVAFSFASLYLSSFFICQAFSMYINLFKDYKIRMLLKRNQIGLVEGLKIYQKTNY